MSSEFGHFAGGGAGFRIDAWGAGPFVIHVGKRSYRFEDSDRFGPHLVDKPGNILDDPWPPERSHFWRAHWAWREQGRKLADDGITCIWREPRPTIIVVGMGGRATVVQHGELAHRGDGAFITIDPFREIV